MAARSSSGPFIEHLDHVPQRNRIHVASHVNPVTERMDDLQRRSRVDQFQGNEQTGIVAASLLAACFLRNRSRIVGFPGTQPRWPGVNDGS